MSPTRLRTALLGGALALCFFCAGLAPGLAHEAVAASRLSISAPDVGPARLLPAGARVFYLALIGDPWEVAAPLPEASAPGKVFQTPSETPVKGSLETGGLHRRKVPRHLLDSILLI